LPIEKQDISASDVYIDSDSKIYCNVVILPGTKIGRHVTIGANSVVSGLIPDFSVAVGAPAKIVKQYNFETKQWKKK
jgi:acetyltransferase-like isoleucine patch superfamily enzyme